jgi:hypothetical protein
MERRAENILPGSEEVGDGAGGGGGEMAQTMYAHMNKQLKKRIRDKGLYRFS